MLRKYSYNFWIYPSELISQVDVAEYAVNGLELPVAFVQRKDVLSVSVKTAKCEVAREKVAKIALLLTKVTDRTYTFIPVGRSEAPVVIQSKLKLA